MANSRPLTAPDIRFSYPALSIVDVHRLISSGQIIESTSYQSFLCHSSFYCCKIGTIPFSSSAVCRHMCIVLWNSHLYQVSPPGFGFLPLLPYTHSYPATEPSIEVLYGILHTCNSIVVQPSSCVYLDFLKAWLDALDCPPGRQVFQLCLECYRAHYNKLIFHFSGKIKEVLA